MKTLLSSTALILIALGACGAKPHVLRIAYDMNGITMDDGQPTPGFGEQLQIQLRDPRVKIFFFSTQARTFMEAQLRRITLPDGRRADKIGEIIPGSFMTDFDAIKTKTRHSPAYKDLRVVSPDPNDLEQTILVDDDEYKAHPKQLGHLLWIPHELGRLAKPRSMTPAPRKNWFMELLAAPEPFNDPALNVRSDLMLGTIQAAINLADRTEINLSRALRAIVWAQPPETADRQYDLRMDRRSTHDALIAFGRKVRANAACARGFNGKR